MRNGIGSFDFDEALKDLRAGKNLGGKDGILAPLIKDLVEAALEAEIEEHISTTESNRRNGYNLKNIKSSAGSFELAGPRDRKGSFEPQIVRKYQSSLNDDIEARILSMYALGMSYADIAKHVEEIYQISISKATIGNITDKIIERVRQWQQRPLKPIYPFVFLDASRYDIREDGSYKNKAVYSVLAIGLDGHKEVLGIYIAETEGAKFWLQVLTDLRNRGLKDILIASVDGLSGFDEAIKTVFPLSEVQLCIVHQIRNSLKYISYKDKKAFIADLKLVYKAVNKTAAENALDELEKKWSEKYSLVIKSWRRKWHLLSNYFKYPEDIRRTMYTTNIIESLHRQYRKLTKTKGGFPNEMSLLKLLYLGIRNARQRWTMPIRNWGQTLSQLSIYFEGRLDDALDL